MSYLGQVELKSSEIRRVNVTGSTSATHTLTWTPPSEQSLIITINGIKQQNNYTISGVTLTLDTALIATDAMEVVGILDIGEAVTPPDDSISTVKIQDDAVTAAKLANSINTEIAANTAKVTNATHTGDVTGATALTIATDAVDIAMLSATGTADATTFLRGDNAWAAASSVMTPAFEAYPSTYYTASSSNVWVKFVMDAEVFDTDGCFDSSTNYRFTPTTAGKYFCYATYTSNGLQNGGRQMSAFYKNGTVVNYTKVSMLSGTVANELSTWNNYIFDMNGSSDYIEFYGIRNDSAGYGYINYGTYFGAYRILT